MAEKNLPVASGAGTNGRVGRPGQFHDGADAGFVEGVGPPGLVTQFQEFVGAHGEIFAVRGPADGVDDIVVSIGGEQ